MIKVNPTARRVILGISIPIFLLLTMYIFVSVYYSGHFYPGTWINGMNCSNKSVTEVMDELEESRSGYTLRIMEREGKTEILTSEDVGYMAAYEGVKDVKEKQGMWTWFKEFSDITFYTVESVSGFEEEKLRAAVKALDAVSGDDIIQPENACIDESEGLQIIPEVQGTVVDEDKLYEVIAEAISDGKYRVDIDKAGCYVKPEVTVESEEFQKMAAELQTILNTSITLHIGGDVYETIDSSITYKWLYREEETSDDGDGGDSDGDAETEAETETEAESAEVLHVGIDKEKVRAYINEIEDKHSTYGNDRQFTTSYDSVVTVYGGYYGWSIDAKKETEIIMEELRTGETIEREVNNDAEAALWGDDEIGDTYIEISIDNQHLWFYKDGQLIVDTPVVTGCVNTGHSTPRGTYQLNNKAVNQTLTSVNPDDPYESFVNYWLPFIGNSYGIHDASWRYYYGGTIYYYDGSHGCVNTPYSKVQVVYQNVEIGTPVVIY